MIAWLCAIALTGAPSFCWAEGLPAAPLVLVEGGEGGLVQCVDDGSAVTLRCTLYAQGPWARIVAGDQVVASIQRTYLPAIYSP